MSYNPNFLGKKITNDGIVIEFYEHPTKGNGSDVLAVIHEVEYVHEMTRELMNQQLG